MGCCWSEICGIVSGMTPDDRATAVNAAVAAVLRAEAAAQQVPWPRLAEAAELPNSTVSTYMRGASPIPLARVDLLASKLGLDLPEVVRRAYERLP